MIACVCAWKSTLWGLFEVFNEERGDESQLQDHPLTHAYTDASAHGCLGTHMAGTSENPPTHLQSTDFTLIPPPCQLWDLDILG